MKIFKSAFFILFTTVYLSASSDDKSIFINENEESAKALKSEFYNKNSNSYSISLSSMSYNKKNLNTTLKNNTFGTNVLAHKYGKDKNKIRVIYGFYPSDKEAKNAISQMNSKLKRNRPYVMKMHNFQNFYLKYYPEGLDSEIIKLQMNNEKSKELKSEVLLSKNIKILKKETKKINIKKEKIESKKISNNVIKKTIKTKVKKIKKRKIDLNAGKYLKSAALEDVYYVESRNNFNILSEVFLKDNSSFYTIDIGELKLNKTSLENFFKSNNLNDNALAYKYGENKEYARIIYGAYEDEISAKEEFLKLELLERHELKVSNIKNHQKLYKTFHNNKMEIKPTVVYEDVIEQSFEYKNIIDEEVIYFDNEKKDNRLKDELFNKASKYYTITLITFDKKDMDIEKLFNVYGLDNDILAYSLGTKNNYYRVLYGLYETYDDALEAIENLDDELQKNRPYISKIKTNQKKYESYKGKVLENKNELLKKIELK